MIQIMKHTNTANIKDQKELSYNREAWMTATNVCRFRTNGREVYGERIGHQININVGRAVNMLKFEN